MHGHAAIRTLGVHDINECIARFPRAFLINVFKIGLLLLFIMKIVMCTRHWRIQEFEKGGHMASARRETIMGVWELCPQWGSGAKSLVRGSGGLRPPESERIYIING